ncbi:MAG TPA: hypothetical protein VHB51_03840 [Candidatus Saccharimonadales bacterium]|nr:hypothetical protein [Candidatus Saccharimonadales bacterium]
MLNDRGQGVTRAIYVDGETKTGKGAAGHAIADALKEAGYKVYYDVAGDFFRRYVALVREHLQLAEDQPLPTGEALEGAAAAVQVTGRAFDPKEDLGDLQRPSISGSVALLSELATVQMAGAEWYLHSAQQAVESDAGVMVLDGRNPRRRITTVTASSGPHIPTALDLYMTCAPKEAARRVLLTRGVTEPTDEELKAQTEAVVKRRDLDRKRGFVPFIDPAASTPFELGDDPADVIKKSWRPHDDHQLPITISLDNTDISKDEMLAAVIELAKAALEA